MLPDGFKLPDYTHTEPRRLIRILPVQLEPDRSLGVLFFMAFRGFLCRSALKTGERKPIPQDWLGIAIGG